MELHFMRKNVWWLWHENNGNIREKETVEREKHDFPFVKQ